MALSKEGMLKKATTSTFERKHLFINYVLLDVT